MSDLTTPGARLTERMVIGQAQGVLMERDDYTARAALAAMHVCAHRLGIDVATVASAVIRSLSLSRKH
jgi:AmiR/NasT family two-component response regulator